MNKSIFLIFFFVLFFCPPLFGAPQQDYIVGEGDVLEIRVYDNQDLDATVRVGSDGIITMALLGQVEVAKKTVSSIARHIEALLADGYLVAPNVSVFVKDYRSKKVTILGQVMSPGLYELQGNTSLLELISKAGGLSVNAGDQATIKRKQDEGAEQERIITIDMKRLIEKGDTSMNMPVYDGDSIYITKAGAFFVTGEVRRPDSYKHEEKLTVIKAITKAGGFTDRASREKVRIIRKIDGNEIIIEKVTMDTPVTAEDVIVVPESFF